MECETKKLVIPGGLFCDLAVTAIFFFVFTFKIIPPHVPAYDPFWNFAFSAFTSVVLSGVFFFALCYLRVTWVDQLRRSRKGIK